MMCLPNVTCQKYISLDKSMIKSLSEWMYFFLTFLGLNQGLISCVPLKTNNTFQENTHSQLCQDYCFLLFYGT